ncbi:MAG: SRPBCC family protein [Burkholderiaceae bacterium]
MTSQSWPLIRTLMVVCCTMLVLPSARAATTRIDVVRDGEVFIIDAVLVAPVSVRDAWAVLTDFDAMSRFVPDLESSRITARAGTRITVEQRGVARWGPLALKFQTVREVDLTPFERVTSHVVSGSLRKVDTHTRFATVANGTEIRHHIELITDGWLPDFVVEGFLRAEVRQQFEALEREMRRRGSVSGPPP